MILLLWYDQRRLHKINTLPFHAHIFIDNNGERESEREKLKTTKYSHLWGSLLKREGDEMGVVL